ncbi:hypothetical protein [Pontibacillus chungwhensis]|uniref:Uncharacterized protein n=1 Tax=Pontibacillus chungwhensis TaxID=265426 RepID=A0ABY8URX7_9BACI|nr:hypothetical protein [Pontibacillus chungwhensis]WIF96247.1 hypothetical protein QNI29_10805 [Pontibacillus chungwhensis]
MKQLLILLSCLLQDGVQQVKSQFERAHIHVSLQTGFFYLLEGA